MNRFHRMFDLPTNEPNNDNQGSWRKRRNYLPNLTTRERPVKPKAAKLTQAAVKAILAARGITFRATEAGDFRINYKGGTESTAYYASDLEDALETGKRMAETHGHMSGEINVG